MAIKDKDGKVFTLRGPNPLMNSQEQWDKNQVVLLNIENYCKEETVVDANNPVEKFNSTVVDIAEELKLKPISEDRTKTIDPKKFIDDLRPKPKEQNVLKIAQLSKPTLTVDPKMSRVLKQRGVEYYCAPAIGQKIHSDDFYGSSYTTVDYGEKFIFDAVIIDQSDLELQFWCVKPITVESIIYKKIRDGGERWWRITQSEGKTGGWLVKAITSDSNPEFS